MSTTLCQTLPTPVRNESRISPDAWAGRLSAPADLDSESSGWSKGLLRHWRGTAADMEQPLLDHHFVVQHLGGPKRVQRRCEGRSVSTVIDCGALSLVPVGTESVWHTEGPIEFAHLYISPLVFTAAAQRFDRGNSLSLQDRIGVRAPLLESLFGAMLAELKAPGAACTLYLDSLFDTFVLTLLSEHCSVSLRAPHHETLPAYRLKRVLEFVETNLDRELTLAELAEVAGGSVFHFSRAFKNALGDPPYRYVLRQRIERAKQLLSSTDLPLEAVASACGFQTVGRFSKTFARLVGDSPTRYRRG